MKIIILLTFICIGAFAATQLTYSHCPSGFDITVAQSNTFLSSSFSKFMFSAYQSSSITTDVESAIDKGDSSQIQSNIWINLIPYIALFVAALIMYLIVICCCVFQKSCPPCESWRRDFVRRPYQKFEMNCAALFTIIFSIAIIILTIVGFIVLPQVTTSLENTQCGLFGALDAIKNGDASNNWGGFSQLKNQIGNISSFLSSTNTQITNYFPNEEWLVADMEALKQTNLNIYKNNKDSKLYSPDPSAYASLNPGDPIPTINSVFITSGLGPNGTANTMTTDIDQGLQVTQKLSLQGYAIYTAAQQLAQSSTTIQANTASAQNTLQMYMSQITTLELFFDNELSPNFSLVLNIIIYAVGAIFGFSLLSGLVIVIGAVATHFFDILGCRNLVHLGWVIQGITQLLTIVLLFLFLYLGAVSYESCKQFSQILNDPTKYQVLGEGNNPIHRVLPRLQPCILGDGDAVQMFDVISQMDTVKYLFQHIENYTDFETVSSVNYIDKTIASGKINGWKDAMEKYRLGIYKDSLASQTQDTNPNYSLDSLNVHANVNGCSKDRWVFDSTNCTNAGETTYAPTASDAHGMALSTTNVICISFNERISTNTLFSWTESDFTRRYVQIRTSCSAQFSQITGYGQALITFRDSRINLFQGIKDDLTDLETLYTAFDSKMSTFSGNVSAFYSKVSNLSNLVTDKTNGLLYASNCSIIGSYMRFSQANFCQDFVNRCAMLALLCILLALIKIGGIITANVFAVRYARVQRDQKVHDKKLIDVSAVSDDFGKPQLRKPRPDSDDSSSSDED